MNDLEWALKVLSKACAEKSAGREELGVYLGQLATAASAWHPITPEALLATGPVADQIIKRFGSLGKPKKKGRK